ncbi:MAG: hypothetical protein J4F36_08150 [Nitrosopumilaceae archaeon]|nr:hypothetical protein [Nitrosopumilaceae archaeon]
MTTKTTTTLVLCSMLLTVAVAMSTNIDTAFATCGTVGKEYAIANEGPTTKGVESKVKPKAFSICGTTDDESYAHAEVSQYTSGTANFVESGIWQGYGAGESQTSMAYNYIVKNSANIANSYDFVDLTDSQSLDPDTNDIVKITVYHDYNSGFPLYRDYYKVIVDNETKNHTITVSNIWSNGSGNYGNVHTEILNEDSEVKAEFDIIKDYSGTSWSNWSGSGGSDSNGPPCYSKVSDTKFKMGIENSGGTCIFS